MSRSATRSMMTALSCEASRWAAPHEPSPGSVTQIDPLAAEIPYESVFAAILDGWRVIHFPDQRSPFDDREIDIVGYEFILEKRVFDDGE